MGRHRDIMGTVKEILTKSFWEDVKKTFDEALEGPGNIAQQAPAEGDLKTSSTSETPSSPRASSEQH
jgi:hypothetical protein